MPLDRSKKLFIAGHEGLVGRALVHRFAIAGFTNIVTRSHGELDLEDENAVKMFLSHERPRYVILAAAKVGGIVANASYPAEFLLSNLRIQNSVIAGSFKAGVEKLLFLGSSCIYPKYAEQPIKETALLTGPLEPTNEWYAIAKIAGIKLCQALRLQYGFDAISVMPSNLYGPWDNFRIHDSHVLPALIRRFVEAKSANLPNVECWGSGNVRREFLHVSDLAAACLLLMDDYSSPEIMNVGAGDDVTIKELATLVKEAVGYRGQITWDDSKPDGTPRKLLDVSRLVSLGWRASVPLRQGVEETAQWYVSNKDKKTIRV